MATFPSKVNYATGDVLTATNMNDIGGAINLLDGAQYAAGKNKIINGDFGINQRAFTSTTTNGGFGFDRWLVGAVDGTTTYSTQSFTPGAAPVAGYESQFFARVVSTGQTLSTASSFLSQKIEDVRTLAGQTATFSFWAKAASGTPSVAVELQQNFGSGGSPSATVNTYAGKITLTTSWVRYSITTVVPSISGKTFGTTTDSRITVNLWTSAGSDLNARTGSLGIQSATIDFWGVQAEEADTASPFQTASGTKQGELALCQRYYQKSFRQITAPAQNAGLTGAAFFAQSLTGGLNQTVGGIRLPVVMRSTPTITTFNPSAANAQVRNVNLGGDWSATAIEQIGDVGFSIQATGNATSGAGDRAAVHYTAEAEL